MSVTLQIVEDELGTLVEPYDVRDGYRITVRRHAQGADVYVVPGKGDEALDVPANNTDPEPVREGDRMLVQRWLVNRDRPGKAEIVITEGAGLSFSLILDDDMALDLGCALTAFSAAKSHEAALARRATAEAELLELEVAERRAAVEGSMALPSSAAHKIQNVALSHELSDGTGTSVLFLRDDQGAVHRFLLSVAHLRELVRQAVPEVDEPDEDPRDEHEKSVAGPVSPPLFADRVSVDGEQQRPGERVLRIGFDDEAGRSTLALVPFGLALKLTSLIGHAVADRIGSQGSA